VDLLPP